MALIISVVTRELSRYAAAACPGWLSRRAAVILGRVKLLLLLRHAAAAGGANVHDHDRPLSEEDRAQAAAVASLLARDDLHPEHVLCSTARRARETLQALVGAVDPAVEAFPERLYLATADDLLATLQQVSDRVERLLVVAHNPGIQRLALALDAGDDRRLERFLPATLAGLRFDVGSWSAVAERTGSLRLYARG